MSAPFEREQERWNERCLGSEIEGAVGGIAEASERIPHVREPMEIRALEASGDQGEWLDLSRLWSGLASGDLAMAESWYSLQECFLMLRIRDSRRNPVRVRHLEMFKRALLGESQKQVAIELGVSVSTVAGACAICLRAMGDDRAVSRVTLPIVMAAHAAEGFGYDPGRWRPAQGIQDDCWVLRIDRPCGYRQHLSRRESEAVDGLVEGLSYAQIAAPRKTSVRTVANQLGSAFRKLGVSGRGELLTRLARESAQADTQNPGTSGSAVQLAPVIRLCSARPRVSHGSENRLKNGQALSGTK